MEKITAGWLCLLAPNWRTGRRTQSKGGWLERFLEDVDRREDDDPHDVHEVPVDARHLDAQVLLRLLREVAAPGADVGEGQQDEADGHVRAVQAREAVEDRAEGVRVGREVEVGVLVDLDEEEG